MAERPIVHANVTFTVAPNHPAFAGHFVGKPIFPGVLLLDAAVHAVMQARHALTDSPACQISTVKFLSPVSPGETLTMVCQPTATGGTRFDISAPDRLVASGLLAPQGLT